MMKIGPKRALQRAAAAPSFGLGGSLLRSLWASHNTPATPATCSSPVMHMAFARLFSTNLSSGQPAFTPFSVGVPSSTQHTSHLHPQHVGVPQTTPVGQMDAATSSLSEHHLDNFEISAPIKAALRQNFKIESLFPVQAECYGPIVEGKDLIGRSKTGSGKTLAFVLPVVQRLKQFPPLPRPTTAGSSSYGSTVMGAKCRVLILEPTRELANQVNAEILKLAHVRTAVLYGGAPVWQQAQSLSRGVDVIVATPGRLLDMVRRGTVSLDEVKTVVLDEADEMLRMGFDVQVEEVMSFIQHQKQVLLFSATLPPWVRQTAARYCQTPVIVDKVTGVENTTPSTIVHKALAASRALPETVEMLRDIFEANNIKRTIIFTQTKRDASAFADLLNRAGVRSRELHGDVPQQERDRTMTFFRAGKCTALVATDVAARGLDIPNVEMVVNVGFPNDHAFYVHRSGRTGRAGKHGVSLLLYMPEERSKIASLTREIGAEFRQMEALVSTAEKKYVRRSLLNSRPNMVTLRIRGGRVDAMQLESRLRELTGQAALVVGRLESTRDYSFTDVPEAVADALASRLEEGGDIAVATELPQEMFGGKQAQWKTNGSGGRGGGSSRGRGGSRGGYGGRPSYGDRDGGDRSSGSRYGNREDRFGGSSSRGGYGGSSRGGSSGYGGNSSYGRGGRDNDGF